MLLGRLLQLGLVRQYPVLTGYLAFDVAASFVLLLLGGFLGRLFHSDAYGWAFVGTRIILWAFYSVVILELYALMVEEYAAIRRLGRQVALSALSALVLAWAALLLFRQAGVDQYPILRYLVLYERGVFVSLSLATLLLLSFAAYFRLQVRRNVWLLFACWGWYFVLGAALLTLREYFGQPFAPIRNLANALFFFLAVLAAVGFLNRQGEVQARPLTTLWASRNREMEAALSLQLQGLNQVLVRVLQK